MGHFIRQQFLNINLNGSETDGFALQRHLPDLFYSKILPAIGEALDQCSPEGKHLVIDRLEIDAGTIELARLDSDLATIVTGELKKIIGKLPDGSGLMYDNQIDELVASQNVEEKLWDVFLYFLKKGSLPWSYQLPPGKSLEVVLSEQLTDDGNSHGSLIPAAKILESLHSTGAAKSAFFYTTQKFSTHQTDYLF